MTDSFAIPFKWTLPSLKSNSATVFTACYCHVSQCLILSNWVMTTTLHSDTSTARSVHALPASHWETESSPLLPQSAQQERSPNPINLTAGIKHTQVEECRHTHTRAHTHTNAHRHCQARFWGGCIVAPWLALYHYCSIAELIHVLQVLFVWCLHQPSPLTVILMMLWILFGFQRHLKITWKEKL